MIDLIFIIAFLALFHFVYESILAPSFRLSLRFKLFALRDELRALKIECGARLDDKHFHFLQDSINALISVLFRVDITLMAIAVQSYKTDPEFRRRVDERAKILDDCTVEPAREIRRKSLWIFAQALAVNCGIFFTIVAPIAIGHAGYSEIKSRVRKVASLSEQDFKRFAPDDSLTASLV